MKATYSQIKAHISKLKKSVPPELLQIKPATIYCATDNEQMASIAKPGLDDWDVFALISKWSLEVEKGKKSSADYFSDKIHHVASRALQEMVRLAFKGHEGCAKKLHLILTSHVHHFDKLCHQNPKLFEPIARKTTYWPALISCLTDTKKRNEQLMEMLNLGHDSGINISGKQPSSDIPEVKAAYFLHGVMEVYRQGWLDQPAQAKLLRAEWRRINKSLGRPANYRPPKPKPIPTTPEWEEEFRLSGESHKLAKDLQPLTRQNYKQWFEASWPLFLSRYKKDFEKRKCFAHYWQSEAFMEPDPSNPDKKHLISSARGDIRHAIKKQIKQAFRSIAPKSSPVG